MIFIPFFYPICNSITPRIPIHRKLRQTNDLIFSFSKSTSRRWMAKGSSLALLVGVSSSARSDRLLSLFCFFRSVLNLKRSSGVFTLVRLVVPRLVILALEHETVDFLLQFTNLYELLFGIRHVKILLVFLLRRGVYVTRDETRYWILSTRKSRLIDQLFVHLFFTCL